MSRRALGKEISEKFYMKQDEAREMVKKVFESLKSLLMKKGKVIIRDFGSFQLYQGKKGKGPDTLKVRFTPSAELLERFNGESITPLDFWEEELDRIEDDLYRKPSKKRKKLKFNTSAVEITCEDGAGR